MLICAIDTSGREGSLALAEGDKCSFEVLHLAPIAGGTYSAQLIPTLSHALAKTGKRKSEIGLLVVASGPGSFTGLRVGISTVKALSDVMQVPVVAISVLEAIAFTAKRQGIVFAALDAQRNEVYVGEYEGANPNSIKNLNEALTPVPDFLKWLNARHPVPVTYTPDFTVEESIQRAGLPAEHISRPKADLYAQFGLCKYFAGEIVSIETLDANYIRRSDAELFSAPKLGIENKS
ncbi:MAG: tRNA (adenosine(37)-N6)-threonylcarbamoyltransferase complex dimerization subunit type 1 TsaB [Terriglobia bacterium]|nr:tRNA (adenosine(37)-N6)-threonylcarbamoyltransferase complex dimerization subunit type 1 TsaB [Terriglobia bacterium]